MRPRRVRSGDSVPAVDAAAGNSTKLFELVTKSATPITSKLKPDESRPKEPLEAVQAFTDDALTTCPACGAISTCRRDMPMPRRYAR